ncbi:MAG: sulfatase-like hydrolase/transferase, partial [Verrucomicrobia bacterium]|nr:sulfatase-like hydrolase/transferase [Verrucomicrobiota bacterium]
MAAPSPPNVLFIFTDDQRHDALGCAGGTLPAVTPAMDRLAARGVRFRNAFVVSAISGASRAAALTGLYGSVNGVAAPGYGALRGDAVPFAIRLRDAGWRTGMAGAWHFAAPPEEAGFDAAVWFPARSPGRPAATGGGEPAERDVARTAAEAVRFLAAATNDARPFLFWMAPEFPDAKPGDADGVAFPVDRMPVPATWNDDLTSRPAYLTTARQRIQARAAGLDSPDGIRRHVAAYLEGVRAMDVAIGRVLDALDRLKLADRTVVILAGGGGRFLGEHGFAGNLLPYEEAMRMPLIVAGPGVRTGIEDRLVLNVDLGATVPALAGLPADPSLHGRSLLPLLRGTPPAPDEAAGAANGSAEAGA